MVLAAEEQECTRWRPVSIEQVWQRLAPARQNHADGGVVPRRLIAIDGRGGAGKSTVTGLLAGTAPARAHVVHTDDVAWHHSFFDWDELLADRVLQPFRRGESVTFTPDAWRKRGRQD